MIILYVHHGKGIGGAPQSLLYTIQGLNKSKFSPKIVFINKGEHLKLFKGKNISYRIEICYKDLSHTEVSSYSLMNPIFWLRLFWQPISYLNAKKVLREEKPDLVHLNSSTLFSFAIAAKKSNIPVVWHIREPLKKGLFGFRQLILKRIIDKYSDAIIAISKNDANKLIQSEKISIIYNFVDFKKFDYRLRNSEKAKKFAENYNLENKRIVTFLGGYSKIKGTLLLAKALKSVKEKFPDVVFVVAGVKKFSLFYNRAVDYFIEKNNLQNNWKYIGVLDSTELLLANSDILVFPAIIGHFARPIIEACAMKVPSIGSDLPGINELIIDGKTGFLFNHKSQKELAEKIIFLLENEEKRLIMGEKAYKFAKENFDQKKNVKKIEKIYEKLSFSHRADSNFL
jgi:glycosyltransferase involved in cell wall biosynthesis